MRGNRSLAAGFRRFLGKTATASGLLKGKHQPNTRMKPNHARRNRQGITFIEILICLVVLTVLLGLFLPALHKAKSKAAKVNCVSCLKQVGLAFRMWANDNGDAFPWKVSTNFSGTKEYAEEPDPVPHFRVVSNELNTPKVLVCPDDKSRVKTGDWRQFTNAMHLSYFIGLGADETKSQTILTGDRTISTNGIAAKGLVYLSTSDTLGWAPGIHPGFGNIGLADGSASQLPAEGLQTQRTKDTNSVVRFVVP